MRCAMGGQFGRQVADMTGAKTVAVTTVGPSTQQPSGRFSMSYVFLTFP